MKQFALLSFLFLVLITWSQAEDVAPPAVVTIAESLLKGIEDNDLKGFHSVCDAEMVTAIDAEALDEWNMLLSEAMLMGYQKEYLGKLSKTGKEMHLWRLNFDVKDIPDMLFELVTKAEKASALSVR